MWRLGPKGASAMRAMSASLRMTIGVSCRVITSRAPAASWRRAMFASASFAASCSEACSG